MINCAYSQLAEIEIFLIKKGKENNYSNKQNTCNSEKC